MNKISSLIIWIFVYFLGLVWYLSFLPESNAISYNWLSSFSSYPLISFSWDSYSVTNESSVSTLTWNTDEFFQVFNTVFMIDESDWTGNIVSYVVNWQWNPCSPWRVWWYLSLDWVKPDIIMSVYECVWWSYNTLFTWAIITLDDPFNSYWLDTNTYWFSFQPYFAWWDNPSSPYTAWTYFVWYTIVIYNEYDGKAIYYSVFYQDGEEFKLTSQSRPSYDYYRLDSYHNSSFNTAHYWVWSDGMTYLNTWSGTALNYFFYGTWSDSLMHFFWATGFSWSINTDVPVTPEIDYYANCDSIFTDVWCYIKWFWDMIVDKITWFISWFFPDIEWTGNGSSCITFSGSTASGVVSPISYTWSSKYIQNVVNMISLMLPFPPAEWADICLIWWSGIWSNIYSDADDWVVQIEYWKWITDEMRIPSFWNYTVFDLWIFVIVGFWWMHLLKPQEHKENVTTSNITTK